MVALICTIPAVQGPLGLQISTAMEVTAVLPTGLAGQCPGLHVGARLTQVAGELVKGLPFDVVLDMLRKSPRPMVLRFVSSAFLCPSLSRANQDGLNPGRATFIV